MLDKVKEAFKDFSFLNPLDLLLLASICKLRFVKSGEYLVKTGDLNYNVHGILKGLVRHYHLDENGNDKTLLFVSEKKPTTSIDCILFNKPSTENIVAIESCIILQFDIRKFDVLAEKNIRILRVQNKQFKETIIHNVEQIKFLTLLTPEERYKYFTVKYPELEQRIKQKYLASYLGITATSLSRMRTRIVKIK